VYGYKVATTKRLLMELHTKEWNEIKSKIDIDEIHKNHTAKQRNAVKIKAYFDYCDQIKPHWLVGYCYPKY
jgi:hypothetical protein